MEQLQQKIRAFHLTGRRDGSGLDPLGEDMKPVLLAAFKDTAALRYDYPVVLNRTDGADEPLLSLSALVDRAVEGLKGDDRESAGRHAYAVEEIIRRRLSSEWSGDLHALWTEAAATRSDGDPRTEEALSKVWTSMNAEGELWDAVRETPTNAVIHCRRSVASEKAAVIRGRIERLIVKLEGILTAEAAGSAAGRTPERLMAGVGSSYSAAFDFDAMSKILAAGKPETTIGDERRERIVELVRGLREQRFYPHADSPQDAYGFDFDHPSEALEAYKARHRDAVDFVRTLRMAELEAAGDYRERVHGPIFENFGAAGLEPDDLADLPDYVVCCVAEELDAEGTSDIVEMLGAGVPFKILVRTDDILGPSAVAEGHISVGLRARQLVQTAIGLSDVYVLQTPASRLYRDREELLAGLRYSGAALFSIYSGHGGGHSRLRPYLTSAAAMGARAFPRICFEPATSESARLRIDGNPSPDEDWETHDYVFENSELQAGTARTAFTFADLLATDSRFSDRFAIVSGEAKSDDLVTVVEALNGTDLLLEPLPYLTVADQEGMIHRAVPDHRVLAESRRCLSMWIALRGRTLPEAVPEMEPDETPEEVVAAEPAAEKAAASEPDTPGPDTNEPYIETTRCTTCNECTQLNGKMFAYDENKQAYIADPDAGTYRQLVEAAESCQVSIIHPGRPRNLNEPGLEDLIKRAEPFN